jgi:hypothetical protein
VRYLLTGRQPEAATAFHAATRKQISDALAAVLQI